MIKRNNIDILSWKTITDDEYGSQNLTGPLECRESGGDTTGGREGQ